MMFSGSRAAFSAASAWSTAQHPAAAVESAYLQLQDRLGSEPDYLYVQCTAAYSIEEVHARLVDLAPLAAVHGCVSHLAVLTDRGLHSQDGRALGLLGLRDPDGRYGAGCAELHDDPRRAAAAALRNALRSAGRPGETPHCLWMSNTPGSEEDVLSGLAALLGSGVPMNGASSASGGGAGAGAVFCGYGVSRNGLVLSAFFPSVGLGSSVHNGYLPTEHSGLATRVRGKELLTIDGDPAASVYRRWLADAAPEEERAFVNTTLQHPLGVALNPDARIPDYLPIQPMRILPEGGLELRTKVAEGDALVLMHGRLTGFADRLALAAEGALLDAGLGAGEAGGAVVSLCAAHLELLSAEREECVRNLGHALGGAPFLGGFADGTQGSYGEIGIRHGNLMISFAVFGRDRRLD